MKTSRTARRALAEEWRQVRRELLGDPETEPDPAADLRVDVKQIQLIVWIAAAKARSRVSPGFGPGEIVSSAWKGVIEALTATPSKRVAALDLRSQMLLRAKHRIFEDDYLGWRGCSKANALAQREAEATPAVLFSALSRDDARWIADALPARDEADASMPPLLESALRELPEGERRVVELFFLEGWEGREIAAKLGVPLSTVQCRIRQAKKRWGVLDRGIQYPREMQPIAARPCEVCERVQQRKVCGRCDTYRRRHGKDRPKTDLDLRADGDRIRAQADALARAWGARSVA